MLFTDLVDSTALLARVGEEEGASTRQALDLIASRSIRKHDGVLVKGTGDGVMAAFASVVDAIDAAVEMQQGVHHRNRAATELTHLRIGISVGEVVHEDGDLFGITVNEAARVCGGADGDHIVVTDMARSLAGTRLSHPLTDPTERELKGLPGSVTTWEVGWTPTAPTSSTTLPGALTDDAPFAGRDHDLVVLSSAWHAVRTGEDRLVLVAGEPGIGKTALAGHLARLAHVDGACVLFGACHDGAVVPFQPFAEALDSYLEVEPFGALGEGAEELARLAPRAFGAPSVQVAVGEVDQHRLFEAVCAWIAELTRNRPVVLVLDDLHWATPPTLAMLRHVVSSRYLTSVLVIGTYRDTDLDRSHPLASMLPELRKRSDTVRVLLRGLTESSIDELVGHYGFTAADGSTAELARALHNETAGNPFFVGEVLRHLRESGAFVERDGQLVAVHETEDLGIPEGVREVLGQRLDRLGPEADTVLRGAAVVGREFPIDLVQAVTGLDEAVVLDVVDRALAARLLLETDRGRLQFSHALVRAALLDEISASRRQRLHRDVAHAMQTAGERDATAISYHLIEAGAVVAPEEIVRAAIAAAEQQAAGTTYDLALGELDRAVDAVGDRTLEGAVEAERLIARGRVLMHAGEVMAARDELDAATTTPGVTPALIVEAALAFHGPARVTTDDDREFALYRRALTLVDAEASPALAARLHANLALGLVTRDDEQREHVARALALAEIADDPLAKRDAARVQFWTSLGVDERSADAAESALRIARSLGSSELVMDDLVLCCIGYGETGRVAPFQERFAEYRRLAESSHSPLRVGFALMVESRLAFGRGDLDASEGAINRAIETTDDEAVLLSWALLTSQLNCYRGRFDEQAAATTAWLEAGMIPVPLRPLGDAGLVIQLAGAGRVDEARALFGTLTEPGLTWLGAPGDWRRIPELSLLATGCFVLDDVDVAPEILALLRPYTSRHLQVSLALDHGPATLALGRLELVCGRLDAAVALLDDAIERSDAADLGLRAAEGRVACALALARRDGPTDHQRAAVLLDSAQQLADERGIVSLQRDLEAVRAVS